MHSIRRLAKWGTGLAFVGGSAVVLHRNNYDVTSLGAVRLSRAGVTVVRIFLDYKITFWKTPDNPEEVSKAHQRGADKLLNLACANGGVWIKVGQHVGALEYLLPPEYTKTLSVLHSRAPESSLDDMCAVFKEDIGKSVSEVFSEMNPVPVGAASLAQVYIAKRADSGNWVAVKIQHPRVKPHSFVDTLTMEFLANAAAYLFPDFKLLFVADEMKKNLPMELDFVCEAKNADRVRRMFSHLSFLKVPRIEWDLTTDRVLTMEFCDGGQVNDRDYYLEHNIDPNQVCRMLGQMYSEMIFIQGYVHCDPHPGNVFVRNSSSGHPEIVLLDHGLYTTLEDDFRITYARLWLAIIQADMASVQLHSEELGVGKLYPLFACMLTARSWDALNKGIQKHDVTMAETKEIKANVAHYLPQISQVLSLVPSPMILIFKTNDLLRGIEWSLGTRRLADAFSFLYMSKSCIRAVFTHSLGPDSTGKSPTLISSLILSLRYHWTMGTLNMYEAWLRFGVFWSTYWASRKSVL